MNQGTALDLACDIFDGTVLWSGQAARIKAHSKLVGEGIFELNKQSS